MVSEQRLEAGGEEPPAEAGGEEPDEEASEPICRRRAFSALQLYIFSWLREQKQLGRCRQGCSADAWAAVRVDFNNLAANEKSYWEELAKQSKDTARAARRAFADHPARASAEARAQADGADDDGRQDPQGHVF